MGRNNPTSLVDDSVPLLLTAHSETMDFVRLEKNKCGPFQLYDGVNDAALDNFEKSGHEQNKVCTVREFYSGAGYFKSDYAFGCKTEKDLFFYFGEDAMALALNEKGYRVAKYRVPRKTVLFGRGEIAVPYKLLDEPIEILQEQEPASNDPITEAVMDKFKVDISNAFTNISAIKY